MFKDKEEEIMKNKILAVLLAFATAVAAVPVTVEAAETESTETG